MTKEKRIAEREKDKAYAEEQLDEQIQATLKLQKENKELKADNDARKFAMAMSEKVEKQLREQIEKMKCDEPDSLLLKLKQKGLIKDWNYEGGGRYLYKIEIASNIEPDDIPWN